MPKVVRKIPGRGCSVTPSGATWRETWASGHWRQREAKMDTGGRSKVQRSPHHSPRGRRNSWASVQGSRRASRWEGGDGDGRLVRRQLRGGSAAGSCTQRDWRLRDLCAHLPHASSAFHTQSVRGRTDIRRPGPLQPLPRKRRQGLGPDESHLQGDSPCESSPPCRGSILSLTCLESIW